MTMAEQQTSGFTAVNGKEPHTESLSVRADGGHARGTAQSHRAEGLGSISSSTEPSPTSTLSTSHAPLPNGTKTYHSPPNHDARSSSPGKRKRTLNDDGRELGGPTSQYDLSPPRQSAPSLAAGPESHGQGPPTKENMVSGIEGSASSVGRDHEASWAADRARRDSYQTNGVGPPLDVSEARLMEAFQHERNPSTPRTWGVGAPHDGSSDAQYTGYDNNRTPSSAIASGPKRKRVFSNRTKTGCMTCRRRKKKCDEGQPLCQNCTKGGFHCEGYSNRTNWPKQPNGKAPVPLQSKEGYVEAEHAHHPTESPSTGHSSHTYEGAQNLRPMVSEAERSHAYANSPTSATLKTDNYPKQGWTNGYGPDPSRPPPQLPSFSSIVEQDQKHFSQMPVREPPMGHAHSTSQQSGSWAPPPHNDRHRPSYPYPNSGPADSRSLQGVAREGLEMSRTGRNHGEPDQTQKNNMLKGHNYVHSDPVLAEDRKRCKGALHKFHDTEKPHLDTSEAERQRKLQEIFTPAHLQDPMISHPRGMFGPGSVIETPFRCQYGYNVVIGSNVFIGENCSIVDAYRVTIGNNTWIGQNVQILTAQAVPTVQARSAGCDAHWQGNAVEICEEAYVGGGCIIYPGVKIGRGAVVHAGTVVKEDIPDYKQPPPMSFMNKVRR